MASYWGTPLYPLLFVVIMEAFCRMLSTIVDRGLFSGLSKGSRNNDELLVSHLLFTDDTLIFCEGNLDHQIICVVFSNALKLSRG